MSGLERYMNTTFFIADVQDLVDHVRPTTRKALCLITCIHRKAQMVSKIEI